MNDAVKAPQTPAGGPLPSAEAFPSAGLSRPLAAVLDDRVTELARLIDLLRPLENVKAVQEAYQTAVNVFVGLNGLVQAAWAQEHALGELRRIAAVTVEQLEDGGVANLQRRAALALEALR